MSMQIPVQPARERASRDAFLAMMGALSRPGQLHWLDETDLNTHNALVAFGLALLDLETTYYAADDLLESALAVSGARHRTMQSAAFAFFPKLVVQDMPLIEQINCGDLLYPDRGATLLVGCEFDTPDAHCWELRGPGIDGRRTLRLGGIPSAFFELRERLLRYPLGFDVFFVWNGAVVGLPRTTQVQPCM